MLISGSGFDSAVAKSSEFHALPLYCVHQLKRPGGVAFGLSTTKYPLMNSTVVAPFGKPAAAITVSALVNAPVLSTLKM